MRKCIIKSNTYENSYLCGTASYTSDLYRAKIFDEDKIPKYILNDSDSEIIFLDSKEGLELLVKTIESLDRLISQEETRLKEMEEGRERLYNANPEMVLKYIEQHNKWNHPLIGITSETKKKIIEDIISLN